MSKQIQIKNKNSVELQRFFNVKTWSIGNKETQ